MKDGTLLTWGKNDRGQLGIGEGVGIDLVESQNLPKEVEFTGQEADLGDDTDPIIVKDFTCGQNTMLIRDSKGRLFKTGLKIDYSPKRVRLENNSTKLDANDLDILACGR